MNLSIIAFFDVMACLIVVFCIAIVIIRRKSIQWLDNSFILLQLSLGFFFISNLLESTGTTVALDPYENFLLPFIWSFWFFFMLKKIQLIELARAHNELQISEQKTRTLLQNLPQKIFLKNTKCEYITCNESYASDFRRVPEEITGKTDYDLFPAEMAEKYRMDDDRIMKSGKTEEIEEKYLQNGRQVWVHTVKTPVIDEMGSVTGILGIFWDITERKKAEESNTTQNAVLSGIMEILNKTLSSTDEEALGRVSLTVLEKITESEMGFIGEIDIKKGTMRFTAISGPVWGACLLLDKSVHSTTVGEGSIFRGLIGKVLDKENGFFTNNPQAHPFAIGIPEGHPELKSFLGVPLILGGKAMGMIGLANRSGGYSIREIEAVRSIAPVIVKALTSKRAEKALKESEENFRAYFDNLTVGTAQINIKGHFIKVNDRYCKITGYSREELCGGMSPLDLDLPEERDIDIERIARFFKDEIPYNVEKRYIRKDTTIVWVQVSVAAVRNANNAIIFTAAIIEDITERKFAEEALKKSEERLRLALHIARMGFWEINLSTGKLTTSEELSQIYGYESTFPETLKAFYERVHPDDIAEIDRLREDAMRTHQPFEYDFRIRLPSGEIRWIYNKGSAEYDEKGSPIRIFGINVDITERKHTEKELHENEERYRALVETSQDLIWQCDRDGRYIYLNPIGEETFGYPLNQLIGRKFTDFQHPDIAARDLEEFERLKNGESVKGYKTRYIGSDGKEIHLTFNARPVYAANGEIVGTRGTAHDITELESAVEKYQSLFNNMIDGFSFHDMIFDKNGNPVDYRFLEVNSAFERITGLNADLIIGKTAQEVLPGIEPYWIDIFGHVASSGEATSFENYSQNLKKHFVVKAFRPSPGKFASIFVDITDRKRAEQGLRESEERLHTILNSLADAVIATDTSGMITKINPAAERLTGWLNGEAVGKQLADVFVITNSDSGEKVPDPVIKVLHNGNVISLAKNTRLISRNDCEYQISDSLAPIRGIQGEITGAVLVFRDVTEEYTIRERLQESEERYRLFYETSPFAIMAIKSFNLCNPNRSATKLFGISAEELKNISPWELSPERQPDGSLSREKAIYYIKEALAGQPQYFEWRHQRRDGTQFDAEIALTRVYLSGEPQITASIVDVTERKNALKSLKNSLHEKETLLQEIYHRTKNNMMVISSFLELQAGSVENEEVDRIIHDSVTRIRTMSLAHEMLYKGKSLSRINMREYIADLAKILVTGSGISPEQVSLKFDMEEIEMLIDIAIPCGLIINELLSNCFKYAFPGKRIGYIAIGLRRIGEKKVEMSVSDNGVGVPQGFDIMKTDTLGVQLVAQIARHQLHATIRILSKDGLSWYIAFREDLYSERV